MTFQEKQTEDVESEQIRTGQACAQKSAHAPEKKEEKKQLLAPIARESRIIRSSTKRKNYRFKRAKR